jgi:hypothetical protein
MLQVPVSIVQECPQYPDRDRSHIYEHLREYLSLPRSYPLPAIRIRVINDGCFVVGGHKYLRIARELGVEMIRASCDDPRDESSALGALAGMGASRVPNELLEAECAEASSRDHQLLFLAREATPAEQAGLASAIAEFVDRYPSRCAHGMASSVVFSSDGKRCQYQAVIPVADPEWIMAYLRKLDDLSKNVCEIESYLGRRFRI